ncbi:MAG: NAD(P)-binding protein, partial [Nitratireductor sp.]|nr:NAD(P)-binding protein [Nitratireductor sp.]
MTGYDFAIVGAGAAGLAAAKEFGRAGKSFIVLEAMDRIGGRAWSE